MRILRKMFTKQTRTKYTTIDGPNHVLYVLGLSLLPVLVLIYLLSILFKCFVTCYLHFKLGSKFHGLLDGADAIWSIEEKEWPNIIPVIYFVQSDSKIDALAKTKKLLRQRVFEHPNDYRKLTSTYRKCLGYAHLLYDTYTLDECVEPIQIDSQSSEYITDDDLKDFVQCYGQSSLPRNNSALWQVYVSTKPMLKIDKNGRNTFLYPILVKLHHMIGDGAALVSFVLKIWLDSDRSHLYLDKLVKKKLRTAKTDKLSLHYSIQSIIDLSKQICHCIQLTYVWVGSLLYLFYVRTKDNNALHGPTLSGQKIIAWEWEDEESFIPLIKSIKNRFSNVTFNDVVCTALSASFSNYFERKSLTTPATFCTAVPVILSLRNLEKPGPAVLKNDFSMTFLKLPSKRNTLIDTLKAVSEQFSSLKANSNFIEINYLTLKYFMDVLPLPLTALASRVDGVTLATSNLPAGDGSTTLGGYDISNIVFFTLNRWKTGVTVSILSYDDRLHIGLLVDAVLISSRKELQLICKDLFHNLKLLAEEIDVK